MSETLSAPCICGHDHAPCCEDDAVRGARAWPCWDFDCDCLEWRPPDPCGGNVKGGPGCCCDPLFGKDEQ